MCVVPDVMTFDMHCEIGYIQRVSMFDDGCVVAPRICLVMLSCHSARVCELANIA